MKKINRTYILIGAAGLLGLIYVIFFMGLFTSPEIAMVSRQDTTEIGTRAILFGLDKQYELTLIRVERLDGDGEAVEEVWSLVGKPRSEGVEAFAYGQSLEGMTVAKVGEWRKALVAGERYRLTLKAGRARGEHEFNVERDDG